MPNPSATRTKSRAATSQELSWSFVLLVILCACFVAAGFFFAARQHFTAMERERNIAHDSRLRDAVHFKERFLRGLTLTFWE